MTLTKNETVDGSEDMNPADPHKTGSGSPNSPGGGNAPAMNQNELTAGQESYPGERPAGEDNTDASQRPS